VTLLKACLNGARPAGAHPALPITPEQLAADTRAAAAAGAGAVHVHPRDLDGRESVRPEVIGAAVRAIRAGAPGTPVGVSTGNWIEPDPDRMLALVRSWTLLPDFASVNMWQPGAVELAEALLDLGVGVEAAVWKAPDVEVVVGWPRVVECLRVLVEPTESDPGDALANAAATLGELDRHGIPGPRLLHGQDEAAWPVLEAALRLGLDTRIGLEDTLAGPDGSPADGNAVLVGAAAELISSMSR
jgi:uncharacterized protein (DUF849 family)